MPDLAIAPAWTEVPQKSGLDPLGLQAASVRLYQSLLPGISNVTLRARYYGLYTWLSREYAQRNHVVDREAWKRMVRRSEALYALVAARRAEREGAETGIAGILWAQRTLGPATGSVDFAAHADPGADAPYLRQAWGAFGAAYESQLREVGLLGVADEHDIGVPTPGIGDEAADAFANSAGELARTFLRTVGDGRVSLRRLDDLAPLLPSEIRSQSRERNAYEKILFATTQAPNERDTARRSTLVLLLRLAKHLRRDIDAEDVRWILYAGTDWDGKSFELVEQDLLDQRRRWWAYQVGDLGRAAYEALLKWLLDTLEGHPSGLAPDELISDAVERLEIDRAGWPDKWEAFVAGQRPAANPLSDDESGAEYKLLGEVLEAGTGAEAAPLRSAQAAIELLGVLWRTTAEHRDFLAKTHGGDQPNAAGRSIANELAFIGAHRHLNLKDLLALIFRERILNRHLWVAMRKLEYQRDYTFLVETENGLLRLRSKDGPVLTNPRLGPALAFLRDIHLLDDDGPTRRGEQVAASP